MQKKLIPIGSHHVIHLMMSIRVKFVFNHLPRPLDLHTMMLKNLGVKDQNRCHLREGITLTPKRSSLYNYILEDFQHQC